MHLYRATNPRRLYLVISSQEIQQGRPACVLVLRAGAQHKVIVELLQKDQVDLTDVVRLTTRVVKGCLGLIAVENGTQSMIFALTYVDKLFGKTSFLH